MSEPSLCIIWQNLVFYINNSMQNTPLTMSFLNKASQLKLLDQHSSFLSQQGGHCSISPKDGLFFVTSSAEILRSQLSVLSLMGDQMSLPFCAGSAQLYFVLRY